MAEPAIPRYKPLPADLHNDRMFNAVPSAQARELYVRIYTACDDAGHFTGEPPQLVGQLYSRRVGELAPEVVGDWLHQLLTIGLLRRYYVDDEAYVELTRHRQLILATVEAAVRRSHYKRQTPFPDPVGEGLAPAEPPDPQLDLFRGNSAEIPRKLRGAPADPSADNQTQNPNEQEQEQEPNQEPAAAPAEADLGSDSRLGTSWVLHLDNCDEHTGYRKALQWWDLQLRGPNGVFPHVTADSRQGRATLTTLNRIFDGLWDTGPPGQRADRLGAAVQLAREKKASRASRNPIACFVAKVQEQFGFRLRPEVTT